MTRVDEREFAGKCVAVTGAARGQGRAHAVDFARRGADVVLIDSCAERIETVPYPVASDDDMRETVALVEGAGGTALPITADVRSYDDMVAAADRIRAERGGADILISQAGICTFGELRTLSPEAWRTMIDINLTGTFNAVRACIGDMVDGGWGRVIATASMAARAGWEHIGHYAASKWGVIGLVKSLALEVAPHGVTANVICPSSVKTPLMLNKSAYRLFRPDLDDPTLEDALPAFQSVNVIPVPYAEPDDISAAAVFLASERARTITGATLSVSAGVNARNI